jgi:hypothetical protein
MSIFDQGACSHCVEIYDIKKMTTLITVFTTANKKLPRNIKRKEILPLLSKKHQH